mgnify:CR=1 FL=1
MSAKEIPGHLTGYTTDQLAEGSTNKYFKPLSVEGPLFDDIETGGFAIQTTGPNAPDLEVLRDGIRLFAFAGTGGQPEQAFFDVHIPHDIKAGTTPTFHIHWTHNNAAPSGDVKWQLEVTAAQGYAAETFPATVTISTTQTAGAQYAHMITSDDDMALPAALASSLEPDMKILCRIFRDQTDAADTFEDDAFFLGADLHYEVGQIATTERNRPFTSAGF